MTLDQLLASIAGKRVYLDTNVLIYFFNRQAEFFPVVSTLIQACSARRTFGVVSDLVIAEVMVHPYRVGDATTIAQFRGFFAQENFLSVARHTDGFLDAAAMLAGQRQMRLLDAIHLHTALVNRCEYLITNDDGFKSSESLTVLQLKDLL